MFGFINSSAHAALVGWEGDADWREGIKYFVFGAPFEMACKANPPPLHRVSWE